MALLYDDANTGIFTRIGKLIKYINAHQTMPATTLPAELKAVVDLFEAADMTQQVAGIYGDFAGWQFDQITIRQRLAAYADNVLLDHNSVLEELGLTSARLDANFWDTLRRKMTADSETIDGSTISIGSITAGAANVGNGTIILSSLLDAYNPPVAYGPALVTNLSGTSELAVTSETMIFECVSDVANGAPSGSESFTWHGAARGPQFDWDTEGSGDGPTITTAAGNVVTDGEFENWTNTNTPSNWTLSTGASAGTTVLRYATPYRGTYAMELKGTGAATIAITQDLTNKLDPGRAYCFSYRLKASSAPPAAGAVTANIAIVTPAGTTTVSLNVANGALTTSYALKSTVFAMPLERASSITLTLSATSTLTPGQSLYFDQVAVQPMIYHGGVAACVIPGSRDFIRGDKFTSAITNDDAGTFQKFFRRKYGVQLPSDPLGSETIADSLAE